MDDELLLGRYRPLAELGEGGYASVTLAWDTRMHRRVAIKRIPLPHDQFAAAAVRAALKEARTAALLNHPNIVTVHEFDTNDDEACLIMEHVDGATLAEVLDAIGALTNDEAAAVLEPVAEALEFAHGNGVLHLDIKPENIMITRNGLVKVADFGIAALTDAMGGAAASGGTLGFMPPEQLRDEAVDARTDQWALAALAYEALTGSPAFAPPTRDAAIHAVELGAVPPSAVERTLSVDVDEALLTALSARPAERYPSIDALADALLSAIDGDARDGRARLAELIERDILGEEAENDLFDAMPLWERAAAWGGVARRGVAALAAAWLAWSGLAPVGLGLWTTLGAAAFVGFSAALAPALGLAVALLALVVGAFGVAPLAGLVVFALGAAVWILLIRRAPWAGTIALAAPVLGVARSPLAVPALVGLSARPFIAAAASAVGGVLSIVLSAAVGAPAPYVGLPMNAIVDPWAALNNAQLVGQGGWHALRPLLDWGPLLAVVAWALGSALVALAVRRGTRAASVVASIGSLGVLAGAYGAWSEMAGTFSLGDADVVIAFIIALLAHAAVIWLTPGVPDAHEDAPDGAGRHTD